MPTLINGCGTWYCGKRRIHRVKTGCPHCGGFAELESYDTTLFFVVFMVPIVPLGQKRILNNCPGCLRHQVIKLKQWEASKAEAFNAVLDKLKANPDDRDTIQGALGLATWYQDERLFDRLADALAGHRTDDFEIQSQLGAAYEYFSRWPDAEAAYARALAVRPADDEIRERLAVSILKQGRPGDAAPLLQHVFEEKDPEKAWLVYWLVEGFMANGRHDEALRIMDVRDELYPKLAKEKAYKTQRRTAEKHGASGKPYRSAVLAESEKAGFREGSGLGFKWPKYVAAALLLGLLSLYLGVAYYRGQHREVYLVNGWNKGYTVQVNGESHQLQPGAATKIEIAEGDVTVDWPDGGDGPQTVAVETGLWGRPFHRPVFVLNPDRLALVGREETIYSEEPVDFNKEPDIRSGQLLNRFEDADYEFEAFPMQIEAKKGSRITKTRVGLVPVGDAHDRLVKAMAALPPDAMTEYVKRYAQLDPDDGVALTVLAGTRPAKEVLEFLKPRLADRPVRVEWHRIYQSLMELAEPDTDLRPEYRKLVEETKRAPDAVYLLGRVEDGAEADKLYAESAGANPPAGHACAGLSFRCLSRGDFDGALSWATKAKELRPHDPTFRQRYVIALLAAGKYADLLQETTRPNDNALFFRQRLTAHVATGEMGAAAAEIARLATPQGPRPANAALAQAIADYRRQLDLELAEVRGERAKYLDLAEKMPQRDNFVYHLLRGEHEKAATAVPPAPKAIGLARDWETEATRTGLLYLAGAKAKDKGFADAQWLRFVEALGRGDRDGRFYAAVAGGRQPFDLAKVTAATTNPSLKRVILAALARKFPALAGALSPLGKKLDFERDGFSLCLRYVTEQ